jgi:D-alanyl-D-alanine carboxypeptidase
MRKKILVLLAVIILAGIGFAVFKKDKASAPGDSSGGNEKTSQNKKPQGQVKINNQDTGKYTIDNQDSIYYIVNKQRALPSGYVPDNLVTIKGAQLRSDTAAAMNTLLSAAAAAGINLRIISGYRSYYYQQSVYNNYVKKDGQAKADTYSARPGHSEHQTGLAADLGTGTCDLSICFGDTAAGKWLLNNSYKYGFIVRYPKGKENLTGYQYEPWHIRYLGVDLATSVRSSGLTLEQYFGLPAATSY